MSGQFENAKLVLEQCAEKIDENGKMSSLSPKLYRYSSNVYQKTEEEEDEEEQSVFAALIFYNLGVLNSVNKKLESSYDLYNKSIKILSRVCQMPNEKLSESEIVEKFKSHSSAKYLMFNIQRSFDAVSLDSILEPAVLLAQCLVARAEVSFLVSELSAATNVSLGNSLITGKEGTLSETEHLSNSLSDAFRTLVSSHPNLGPSLTPDVDKLPSRGASKSRGTSRNANRKGISLTSALIPQGTTGNDSSADLLRAQEVLGPFRRLLGASTGGGTATSITTETITAMKIARHTTGRSTAASGTKTPSSAAGGAGFVLPKLSSAGNMLEPPEDSTVRAPGFASALKSAPKCSNSVRANMLVVPEGFQLRSVGSVQADVNASRTGSRKEGNSTNVDPDKYTATVVEWALMICEGASLGLLGVPMISMQKDFSARRRDKERERLKAEAKGAREKLQDCLQNHKPKHPAILLSVYSTLAKLCMQMGLRTDAGGHIAMLEETALSYNQQRPIVLAKKFRMDYEEWLSDATTPSTMPSQTKLKKAQALLVHCKSYYVSSKNSGDLNLIRDACKRLMNLFIDISNIPDPLGTPPREMGSVNQLAEFTDFQVEENESSDILWMKLFSRARAVNLMRELRSIGAPPASEENDEVTELAISEDSLIKSTEVSSPGKELDAQLQENVTSPDMFDAHNCEPDLQMDPSFGGSSSALNENTTSNETLENLVFLDENPTEKK